MQQWQIFAKFSPGGHDRNRHENWANYLMIVQLDAAQVIELIDDESRPPATNRLRELLKPHWCGISTSVLIDLRKKIDQPRERYRAAFRSLRILWAIDAGKICTLEVLRGFEKLKRPDFIYRDLDRGFVFRDRPLDALNARMGLEILPQWLQAVEFEHLVFMDFGHLLDGLSPALGELISNVFRVAGKDFGDEYLKRWTKDVPAAVAETPPTLQEALARAASAANIAPWALPLLNRTPEAALVKVFPANALTVAFRRINHDDRKSRWTPNDIVDLFHVAMAVYCDSSFMDRRTAKKVNRAQELLEIEPTAVPNAEAISFLETQRRRESSRPGKDEHHSG